MWRTVLLFNFLFAACSPSNSIPSNSGDDTSGDSSYIDPSSEYSITIKELRTYYTGLTTLITDDIVIDGIVMVNDAFGELYKSFIIEDGTAAVKVMCDIENVATCFAVGSQVSIRCSSLWLGASGASIQLGKAPTGSYAVDYIEEEDINTYIKVTSDYSYYPTLPSLSISDLSDNEALRSITFKNLTFKSASTVTHYAMLDELTGERVATYHTLCDADNNEISLYVSPHVSYASQRVPTGEVTFSAIIERYGSNYSLMIVNGVAIEQ